MWTYERFMSILNRYILNRANPEGCMIEGYGTEEVIKCCLAYLKDNLGIGLPASLHQGRLDGIGTVGRKSFIDKDLKAIDQAHYSIMQYITVMEPFIEKHLSVLSAKSNASGQRAGQPQPASSAHRPVACRGQRPSASG